MPTKAPYGYKPPADRTAGRAPYVLDTEAIKAGATRVSKGVDNQRKVRELMQARDQYDTDQLNLKSGRYMDSISPEEKHKKSQELINAKYGR
jgi:hypothetical protein